MPMHKTSDSGHEPEEIDASPRLRASDVRVTGIVVFLVSLAIFVAVGGVFATASARYSTRT